jgi:hypothetical protein
MIEDERLKNWDPSTAVDIQERDTVIERRE